DGTRAGTGAALFDGDGRGQSFDEIDVRLLHLVEELPGVGGEGFDIFTLALGINGIEGERRFAAAAEAGNDDQFVAWNLQREIFQVMLTRPADPDEFFTHRRKISD